MASSNRIGIKVESYRRRIDLTDAIKQILNDYPMGSGIIRELLQNSDDAGASRQILVLDHRKFETDSLVEPALGRYQGPALLAFNDSRFTETDWESLKSISNSLKRDDISKAGKFGLGFNVVHHVTDAPAIMSGRSLVLLDPHEDLVEHPGGCQVDFTEAHATLQHQLSAFDSLCNDFTTPLDGTIVRLPLRTDASHSRIKKEETSVIEIRNLMNSFVQNELDVCLLFLKHLKEIELREVLETGESYTLARAELLDVPGARPWTKSNLANTSDVYQLHVNVKTPEYNKTDDWIVRHEVGDVDVVASQLIKRPERANMLKDEKLYPHVAVAIPLSRNVTGRLFTSLPLPINTMFPVHINGLFALTTDRQSLRNPAEKAEPDSRESILQLWNTYLFQDLIPHVWACILEDVKTFTADLYYFWPTSSPVGSYWNDIDVKVLKRVLEKRLPVWPLFATDVESSGPKFSHFDGCLLDMSSTDPDLLSAISQAGVDVITPAPHILQSITKYGFTSINDQILTPVAVSRSLKVVMTLQNLENLPSRQKVHILLYFLRMKDWDQLLELPIIPRIDDSFVALRDGSRTSGGIPSVIFASEYEVNLFQSLETRFFDQSLVTKVAGRQSTTVLELPENFVSRTDARRFALEDGCNLAVHQSEVGWLSKVHEWADSHWAGRQLDPNIDRLPLPLSDSTTLPAQSQPPLPPILLSDDLTPPVLEMFHELGVPMLDKGFKPTRYLEHFRRVSKALDAEVLLQWFERKLDQIIDSSFSLRETMHYHLSNAVHVPRTLNVRWIRVLQTLPVFISCVSGPSQSPSKQYLPFGRCPFYLTVRVPEVLPVLPEHTFLDISQESNSRLIKAVDNQATPSSDMELARIAADNLHSQPEHLIDTIFEHLILPYIYPLHTKHQATFNKLRETAFISTSNGRKAPSALIDPIQVNIHGLFTNEDAVSPTGPYSQRHILDQIQSVPFFIKHLSVDMVEERIKSYAKHRISTQVWRCAENLLDVLDRHQTDINLPISLGQHPWLPIEPGKELVNPNVCRDESQRVLVSRVYHILPRTLKNPRLHEALGWATDLPASILQEQFRMLVNERPSADQRKTMKSLLSTLADRLDSHEVEMLRASAGDKAWIPFRYTLLPTRSVYISGDVLNMEPAFFRLPDTLTDFSVFFSQIGVPDLPHPEDIVRELQKLSRSQPSSPRTELSVRLLEAISMTELTQAQRGLVLVPDVKGDLYPPKDMIFNDRGQRDGNVHVSGHWVHSRVSEHVATRLDLKRSSAILVDRIADDDAFSDWEQYETLQSKIRQTLLGYSYMSTCNEILANADDAKATEASVVYDKRCFSETGDLCPALRKVHGGPALVAHNNACFTDSDWDGLRKLAVGSKGDSDTIGRFGLGALTFYHWTDVPMIVSGDYVLFLDPSGVHLPVSTITGLPRRGLKINLRDCDDGRFDGTFEPLKGVFGFDPREFYRGTLIRLPLRVSKSKFLGSAHEIPDINKFLERCLDDSRMAFLFTRCLKSITVSRREVDGLFSMIVTTLAAREDFVSDFAGKLGNIMSKEVTVSQMGVDQKFLVVTSTIPAESLPPQIQMCARNHRLSKPSVGLAYPICPKPPFTMDEMRLMSTLTIGVTELPVHIHGEFVLSSDRKSIRMDKISSTSLETQYNEFLFEKLAPAYLFLIHLCLQRGFFTFALWPSLGHAATEVLAREIYHLLPEFPGALFQTGSTAGCNFQGRAAPVEAVFNKNTRLTSFLLQMDVPNLVLAWNHTLTPEIVPSLQFDDAGWVRDLVMRSGERLQGLFDGGYFGGASCLAGHLISYIVSSLGTQGLLGLRLLPTTALHVFESCEDTDMDRSFLIPSPEERMVFPFSKHRFTRHLTADVITTLSAADVGLNVRPLLPKLDLRHIMAEAFPVTEGFVHASDKKTVPDAAWHSNLTDYITAHNLPVKDLRRFTFIPLLHPPETYISAESSETLFAVELPTISKSLSQAIKELEGFHTFLEWSGLPPGLVTKPEPFNLSLFVRWLDSPGNSWESLGLRTQNTLVREVTRLLQDNDFGGWLDPSSPLAQIPIWPCQLSDTIVVNKPAASVVVPPKSLDSRFMDTRYFKSNRNYAFLTVPKLRNAAKALGATVLEEINHLIPFLSLPGCLQHSEIESFAKLLAALLPRRGDFGNLWIAPDRNLNLRAANELFDPRVALFNTTLDSSQLLHPGFEGIAPLLIPLGFRGTVDANTLEQCAKAVDRAVRVLRAGTENAERARMTYTSLSGFAGGLDLPYERFQYLAFIPRQDYALSPAWRQPYIPQLAAVVSTSQLVLQDFVRIAWTQRVRPLVSEVVEHLVILATVIAPHVEFGNINNFNIFFIQDLRETYEYLQEHLREDSRNIKNELSCHSSTPIFLNVEHPQQRWTWVSADSLVLDIDYDIPTRGLRHVQNFLVPYADLLVATGVKGITPVDIRALYSSADIPDTYPQSLLTGLQDFLAKDSSQDLADTTLIAVDPRGENSGQLRAHKVILAATSEWFRTRFCGSFRQTNTVDLDISLTTLRAMIDYFYNRDPVPERMPPEHQEQDVIRYIQILLDILVAADQFMLPRLSKVVETRLLAGEGRFIRVTTAHDILKYARTANSGLLVQACEGFIDKNSSYFVEESAPLL